GLPGKESTTSTAEELRAYDPEKIVLAPCGYYKEDTISALRDARLPEGWHDLAAVRDDEVWAVDATAYFSRPGPRVVRGAEILARVLHPDTFGAPEEHEAVRVAAELMKT
ncbi:MAG TPA: hypothetical protein VM864_00990, partial [Pyrinomonadaceae bacterium]|nr:hypothetical protein [Pyrinomonadaceae bacterium]